MELTTTKAKEIAKKYLLKSGMEDSNFIYAHTKGVVNAAKLLAKKDNLDENFLESVAWVHDIGQVKDLQNHSSISLELLEKENIDINDKIKDCILNHGNGGKPKTDEGKIMNIADKISILDKDFLKEVINMGKVPKEHIDFIKMLTDEAIDRLNKLK